MRLILTLCKSIVSTCCYCLIQDYYKINSNDEYNMRVLLDQHTYNIRN